MTRLQLDRALDALRILRREQANIEKLIRELSNVDQLAWIGIPDKFEGLIDDVARAAAENRKG